MVLLLYLHTCRWWDVFRTRGLGLQKKQQRDWAEEANLSSLGSQEASSCLLRFISPFVKREFTLRRTPRLL